MKLGRRVQHLGFRHKGLWPRAQHLGFRHKGLWPRALGSEFGLGFGVGLVKSAGPFRY